LFFVVSLLRFFLLVIRPVLRIVLRVQKGLPQLRRKPHASRRKLPLLPGFVPPLLAGKIQGHGDIAHQKHFLGRFTVQLNERILSWQGVLFSGATIALVIPFNRATGINSDSAWNASYTCMCGMISSLSSMRSLVICSAEISVKPR